MGALALAKRTAVATIGIPIVLVLISNAWTLPLFISCANMIVLWEYHNNIVKPIKANVAHLLRSTSQEQVADDDEPVPNNYRVPWAVASSLSIFAYSGKSDMLSLGLFLSLLCITCEYLRRHTVSGSEEDTTGVRNTPKEKVRHRGNSSRASGEEQEETGRGEGGGDAPLLEDLISFSLDVLGLFLAWCLSHYILLGKLGCQEKPHERNCGPAHCVFVLLCAWNGDNGALVVGRIWGQRRVWPRVSPRKTLAGVVGSLLGASLTALVFPWLGQYIFGTHGEDCPSVGLCLVHPGGNAPSFKDIGIDWRESFLSALGSVSTMIYHLKLERVGHGLIIGGLAVLGDLLESLLKRVAGVRDSGTLLSAHGGFFDRVDSLLLAGPYYFYVMRSGTRGSSAELF